MTALVDRLRALGVMSARATPVPLLVRCAIFLVALAALAVAVAPAVFFGRALPILLLVAVAPAVAPRRAGPTVAAVVAVVGWIASTYGERIVLWRLLALAAALYLVHALSALAAALPYDAEADVEVVAAPVLRALGVLLASGVLSIVLLGVAGRGASMPPLAALLGGLAGAVGTAATLGWLLRRR